MKRKLACICIVLILTPFLLSARSLFDARFGFNALYVPSAENGFSEEDISANTTVGGNVSLRLWNIQTTIMAVAATSTDSAKLEGFNLYSDVSVSIPLLPSYIYLTLGAGLGTDFRMTSDTSDSFAVYFPSYGEAATMVPLEELIFGQVLTDSSVFWKAGLDVFLGPLNLNVFYLLRTPATIASIGQGEWGDLIRKDTGSIGVGFSLAIF